jgi:hypothetical protein
MEAKDLGGLCSTCINAGFCINLKARQRGAVQCELFDHGGSPAIDLDRIPSMAMLAAENKYEACLGLCSTCDLAKECMMAQPQGGVWHCEEYC